MTNHILKKKSHNYVDIKGRIIAFEMPIEHNIMLAFIFLVMGKRNSRRKTDVKDGFMMCKPDFGHTL